MIRRNLSQSILHTLMTVRPGNPSSCWVLMHILERVHCFQNASYTQHSASWMPSTSMQVRAMHNIMNARNLLPPPLFPSPLTSPSSFFLSSHFSLLLPLPLFPSSAPPLHNLLWVVCPVVPAWWSYWPLDLHVGHHVHTVKSVIHNNTSLVCAVAHRQTCAFVVHTYWIF